MNKNIIICLCGMHRSGTSLMASYLESCGIPMGDELLGSGKGNELGHFEDLEFLEFHKDLLAINNTDMFASNESLRIPDEFRKRAICILQERTQKYKIWGWKEPRTTLFLPFWNDMSHELRFVFLYRDPYEVTRSLLRRMKLKYLLFSPWKAPQSWLRYNRALLDFYQSQSDDCLLISLSSFINNSEIETVRLARWLGVDMSVPFKSFYHPSHMNKSSMYFKELLINAYMYFVKKIYGSKFTKVNRELSDSTSQI